MKRAILLALLAASLLGCKRSEHSAAPGLIPGFDVAPGSGTIRHCQAIGCTN